ncbi:hypothetical protein ES288_A07G243200v1, partial [Gossypium darwinii]
HHYHPKPSHHGSPPFTFSLTLSWTLDNHHQPKLLSTVRNIPPLTPQKNTSSPITPHFNHSHHHSKSFYGTNLLYQPQYHLHVNAIK